MSMDHIDPDALLALIPTAHLADGDATRLRNGIRELARQRDELEERLHMTQAMVVRAFNERDAATRDIRHLLITLDDPERTEPMPAKELLKDDLDRQASETRRDWLERAFLAFLILCVAFIAGTLLAGIAG